MKWLPYLLVSVLAFGLGWIFHPNQTAGAVELDTIVYTNTVREVKVDTLYMLRPIPYVVSVDNTDTIYVSDSCYHLREYKEYQDSNFYAKVSGAQPRLDEIRVYPRTERITEYVYRDIVKKDKWGRFAIGLSAGYGISDKGVVPYIGVSFNYNLFNF